MAVSIGKTPREIHADLVAEGQDVTIEEVESKLAALEAGGWVRRADFSRPEIFALSQSSKVGGRLDFLRGGRQADA